MSRVTKQDKEMKEYSATLLSSTEKAWMLAIGEYDYWVPKSISKWIPSMPDSDTGKVSLPMWYVKQNEVG